MVVVLSSLLCGLWGLINLNGGVLVLEKPCGCSWGFFFAFWKLVFLGVECFFWFGFLKDCGGWPHTPVTFFSTAKKK